MTPHNKHLPYEMRPGHTEPMPETALDWVILGIGTYVSLMLVASPFLGCIALGMALAK